MVEQIDNTIIPLEEMISYETLWAINGMTEKKISELFKNERLPSDVINEEEDLFELPELQGKVDNFIQEIQKEFKFSVSIFGDYQYPKKLRDSKYPPEIFYYQGDIGLIESKCISIVGSRNCTFEGRKRTLSLTEKLVKEGFTIVSGLAKGIDSVALKTAIKFGGKVIAIIGTALDYYYPAENEKLQKYISKEHLLISRVPFYRFHHEVYNVRKIYFPQRNKMMSALSLATVIIEAGNTSGTLTQARAALQQGRKLFILNSCFENKDITWPAYYEKRGAIRVNSVEDILKNL